MKKIMLLTICLALTNYIYASWNFWLEYYPMPYRPYTCLIDMVTGMNESPSSFLNGDYKVVIANGKIMDSNGDYILSEKYLYGPGDSFNVMWDSVEIGYLFLYSGRNNILLVQDEVYIDPYTFDIGNKTYTGNISDTIEWTHIRMQDITISNGATVNFNGIKGISILPGFHAKQGSTVSLKSYMPSPHNPWWIYANSRNTTEYSLNANDKTKAYLEQNTVDNSKIKAFIPEGCSNSSIMVQDIFGYHVKQIKLNQRGTFEIELNTKELKSGIYVYSLIVDGALIDSKKINISGK